MCDEISANALICVLQNNHGDIYCKLFDQEVDQKLILVPVAHSLINVHISEEFVECHILCETEVPNVYLNLHGQALEVTKDKVITSFGFKSHISANIIRYDKIHDVKGSVRVCLISDYLLHDTPSCQDVFDLQSGDTIAMVDSWFQSYPEFHDTLHGALDRFKSTFIMVAGYESEVCSILCSHVERAVSIYIANKNKEMSFSRNAMCEVVLNFVFMYLYDVIMEHLRQTYRKEEDIIQNRILKLRKEMNLNSTLNLLDLKRQVNNYNLTPSCEALKMMSEARLPQEKHRHLEESIQLNKSDSKDDAVSFFILTMVAGGINDAFANYAFMHMYADGKYARYKTGNQYLDTFKGGLQFLLEQF